jgi:hypothetical protein
MSKVEKKIGRFLVLIALPLAFFFLAEKSDAGGGEGEGEPVTPEVEVRPKKERINATANFNWDKWSQPYWWNNYICRDKSSQIVCLSSQRAQNLGWNIPSDNESNYSSLKESDHEIKKSEKRDPH